jgi:hypothetical protein
MIVFATFVVVVAAIAQAFMIVSFLAWTAGLFTAVSYGLMSRTTIPVCAAILTAIGYLVETR